MKRNPKVVFEVPNEFSPTSNSIYFHAKNKYTKNPVLIKVEKKRKKIQECVQKMQKTNSKFVIKYLDSYLENNEEGEFIWIVFEHMDFEHTLNKKIALFSKSEKKKKIKRMAESTIRIICRSIIKGLICLQDSGFDFHEIKPSDILIQKQITQEEDIKLKFPIPTEIQGALVPSPIFLSPETIKGSEKSNKSVVWSLGMILLLLAGNHPNFLDYSPLRMLFLIATKEAPKLENKNMEWSFTFKDFVSSCLQKDFKKRFSLKELLKHPFLTKKKFQIQLFQSQKQKLYTNTVIKFKK